METESGKLVEYFVTVSFGDELSPMEMAIPEVDHIEGSMLTEMTMDPTLDPGSPEGKLSSWLHSIQRRAFRCDIVDRYPLEDNPSCPLPPIAMFCIPEGVRLSTDPDLPSFYNFCATGADGVRVWGSCLRFFEEVPMEKLASLWAREQMSTAAEDELFELKSDDHESLPASGSTSSLQVLPAQTVRRPSLSGPADDSTNSPQIDMSPRPAQHRTLEEWIAQFPVTLPCKIYAPTCIVVLSTYPFLNEFRTFLTELYRCSLCPQRIPLERRLYNFVAQVPLPPRGLVRVIYRLHGASPPIIFRRPAPNDPLSFFSFPLRLLSSYLDVDTIIVLMEAMCAERRILLSSSSFALLSVVCQAMLTLFHPFTWSHVFIPLLPHSLTQFIDAPMPFMCVDLLFGT